MIRAQKLLGAHTTVKMRLLNVWDKRSNGNNDNHDDDGERWRMKRNENWVECDEDNEMMERASARTREWNKCKIDAYFFFSSLACYGYLWEQNTRHKK